MMMMYEEELGISILIKMGEAMILNFKFQKYSKEEYVQWVLLYPIMKNGDLIRLTKRTGDPLLHVQNRDWDTGKTMLWNYKKKTKFCTNL